METEMRGLSVDEVILYGYLMLQLVKIFDRGKSSSEACASIGIASMVAYAVVASTKRVTKRHDDDTADATTAQSGDES